jgi:calcineurin-like phosphoesterase family protein
MPTWFTADLHLGHANIIRLQSRTRGRFRTIGEHDEHLIRCWNDRVRPDDDVFVVGDFGHPGGPSRLDAIFSRLMGHKRLIIGNHDEEAEEVLALPWAEAPVLMATVMVQATRVVMSHYPFRTWAKRRKSIHVYGHVHGSLPGSGSPPGCENGMGGSCDVGVDAWNLVPVQLSDIRKRIGIQKFEAKLEGDFHLADPMADDR